MSAFGLSLAAAVGGWIFVLIQAQYFFTKHAVLRFQFHGIRLRDLGDIISIGFGGALSQGCQVIRMIILNGAILSVVGNEGLSAFTAVMKRHFPRNMDELMVVPDDFGVPEEERMDISLHTLDSVIRTSESVQKFCLKHGFDERRAYLAGLCMEEMAGNVLKHGFIKDPGENSVDIRYQNILGLNVLTIKL